MSGSSVAQGERPVGHLVGKPLLPQVEAPCIVRDSVDRLVGRAVEVDLEAGRARDKELVANRCQDVGQRIFLEQPLGIAQRRQLCNLWSEVVSGVNRRCDHRAVAASDFPSWLVFVIVPPHLFAVPGPS